LRNLSNVISVSQLIFFERRYVAYTTDGKKMHKLRFQSMFIFPCDVSSRYGGGGDEKGGRWRQEPDTFCGSASGQAPRVSTVSKIGVILHRMWIDGKTIRWTKEEKIAPQIALPVKSLTSPPDAVTSNSRLFTPLGPPVFEPRFEVRSQAARATFARAAALGHVHPLALQRRETRHITQQ
jgi:hypothetical protein